MMQEGVFSLDADDLSLIPKRKADSHKGTYGKVLVVAGKKNMAGAAFFSGKAALTTGCGMVRIISPEDNRVILQSLLPEATLGEFTEEGLQEGLKWADAVVVGPGLGTGEEAEIMVKSVLKWAKVPVVVDADGLNLLARNDFLRSYDRISVRPSEGQAPLILTPHLGEMSRLCNKTIEEIQDHKIVIAKDFAWTNKVIVALKDASTVCALTDGKAFVNESGNDGMATAGSGDVLTGVIAGLLAQGCEPQTATPLGVYLHGLAGDVMVKERGHYGLIARDIIEGLTRVMEVKE